MRTRVKTMSMGPSETRRRWWSALLPAAAVLWALLGPQLAPARAVQAGGADAPSIAAGAEVDYPPFSIVEDGGRATGFSLELLRAALKAMGREVTFRTGPWEEVRGWLERGEIQALPLVGRTPEREPRFDFTVPYMSLHGAIVVRHDAQGIQTLEDLRGQSVAVMKGDNAEEFLRREDRGIIIHTTATFEEALQELSQGRHAAVVIQRLVALRLLQETGLASRLRVVDRPIEGFRQDFCFAVREGDRETLALLNEGLALVVADGTQRRLHAQWFAALELPTRRRIVVGGDYDYPPYEFLDEKGRPAGFVVELTRAIARDMGLDIEIRLGPWADMVAGLESGEVDVIQGMYYSPERDRRFDFAPPHMVNHYVGVVRRGEGPPPAALDDLKGRRIVVQRGDLIHDFLVQNGLGDRLTLVETQAAVLEELADGRQDRGLVARIGALYLMEQRGWQNLELGRRPFLTTEYAYAVADGQKALLAEFSEGLRVLEESGEYRRIHEKWMGIYDEARRIRVLLRYLVLAAAPLLALVLGIALWSRSLRRQVALRTAQVRESEQHFRTLADSGRALIWTADPDRRHDYFNRPWLEFTGYTLEQALEEGWRAALHPEDLAPSLQVFEAAFARREPYTLVYRMRRHDGAYRWIQSNGSPRYDTQGRFLGFIGHSLDITDLMLAQERIEHLVKVLRAIRDVNQLIVHERDPQALIREATRLMVDHRGYASALLLLTDESDRPTAWAQAGQEEAFEDLKDGLERGELPPCCEAARSTTEVVALPKGVAVCRSCPLARAHAGADAMCVRLVNDGRGFGYLSVVAEAGQGVDAEERSLLAEMAGDIAYALRGIHMERSREAIARDHQALQEQMIQAQKMEAVGRLAGGVAHDYNNILGVILGYTELVLEKVTTEDPLHEDLQEILVAARRSRDITRQLLAFARKETIAPEVLDLNETVEGLLKMLRRLIGEDIHLTWRPAADLWPVTMDPSQVDQILANLCVNARDAIADVGHITIETGRVAIDADYCVHNAESLPGDFVMLTVSDDGCGMDRATLDLIFEPFFTTKEVGRGTGLGLATVYGIVKQNSGFINVYSEPGKGTTFRIYLPRHAGGAEAVRPAVVAETAPGRGETVLVVEDDAAILKLAERILKGLGYRVMKGRTPTEALKAAVDAGSIALLLTDVVMPEMNGRELANRLKALHPGMKTLFMSGYTANVIAHRGVLEAGVNFIPKPFSRQELAAKVKAVLERG